MSAGQTHLHPSAFDRASGWRPPSGGVGLAAVDPPSVDEAFIALQCAYRPHGGISRLAGLPGSGRVRSGEREVGVAGLVAAGQVVGFDWHHTLWIPLFQFVAPGLTQADGPRRVVAEWDGAIDGWALAAWFVQPNLSLGGHSPIDGLTSHLPEVLQAARADRFVATA